MLSESVVNKVAVEISDSVSALRSDDFIKRCMSDLENNPKPFQLNSPTPEMSDEPGIYLFWANFGKWIEGNNWDEAFGLFLDSWSNPIGEIKYYPRFNKKRANKTFSEYDKSEWLPFYLGKSRNINSRVSQHIKLGGEKKTYALKLDSMSGRLQDIDFMVGELPMRVEKENHFLLELIESEIRSYVNPIIGKQ